MICGPSNVQIFTSQETVENITSTEAVKVIFQIKWWITSGNI